MPPLPRDTSTNPRRAMSRDPDFPGIPQEFIDAWKMYGPGFMRGMTCPPEWVDHDRQEFRLASTAETVIFTKQVLIPGNMQLPGFYLRIQTPYDQLFNNILTTNGLQAPLLVFRIEINGRFLSLSRNFKASRSGGEWWVPACVKTQDVIKVFATCSSAGQISNSPIRIRTEVSVGAELPLLDPFDARRNTQRTFAVLLPPIPVVPTILIGAGSIFVATIPNAPWFIVPNTLQLQSVPGSAAVNVHGVSVGGAIDAGGVQLDNIVGLPTRLDVDRLDKVAISKPAAAAAILTMTFALYD